MTIRIVDGAGTWQNVTDMRVQSAGNWERVQKAMVVDDNGLWVPTFIYDNTGPSAPTSLSTDWVWVNSTGSYCVVNWTQPTDADFSYSKVYVNKQYTTTQTTGTLAASAWTEIATVSGAGAKSINDTTGVTTYSYTVDGANLGSNIHYYRIIPFDVRNNPGTPAYIGSSGQGSTTVRGIRSSPYWVNSGGSRTYRDGDWRTDTAVDDSSGGFSRVAQGKASGSTLGWSWGFWWYPNRPTSLNITKADILMGRQTATGSSSAVGPRFRLSGAPSTLPGSNGNPTGYTVTSTYVGTGLTPGGVGTMLLSQSGTTISLGDINNLMLNLTYRSVAVYVESESLYAVYYGSGDFSGSTPYGSLSLTHTG